MKVYKLPDHSWSKTKLFLPETIEIYFSDIVVLLRFEKEILNFGLSFIVRDAEQVATAVGFIDILTVPTCLYGRFSRQRGSIDKELIANSLVEIVDHQLKKNNDVSSFIPSVYRNVINYEACRGAYKFGDILSKDCCIGLIVCDNPKFCPHGRPTIVPIGCINELQISCDKTVD